MHPCDTTPPQVSDTSDISDKFNRQANPTQPELTYSQGTIQERKSLLKTWLATVIGSAIAFGLVSGIKDIRALVTTSMSAGSIAFVVSVLGNKNGN